MIYLNYCVVRVIVVCKDPEEHPELHQRLLININNKIWHIGIMLSLGHQDPLVHPVHLDHKEIQE